MKMILFIKITLLLALNWKLALEVYAEMFDSCNPKNITHSSLLEVFKLIITGKFFTIHARHVSKEFKAEGDE